MKIFVTSKIEFDAYMLSQNFSDDNIESFSDKLMLISIHDADFKQKEHFKQNHSNVLRMYFDDCSDVVARSNGYSTIPFNRSHGDALIDFIQRNKDAKVCIVHCTAGISRSGAVGTFINDFMEQDYYEFLQDNPHILHNSHILSMLNKIIREKDL
jgi:predicted protein tyrosine phosphatase